MCHCMDAIARTIQTGEITQEGKRGYVEQKDVYGENNGQ